MTTTEWIKMGGGRQKSESNPQKCDNMMFQMAFLTYIKSRIEKKINESFKFLICIINVSWILTSAARISSTAQYVCVLTARPQL